MILVTERPTTRETRTLHFSVVYDGAFLVASGHARNRLWTAIQRAMRRAPAKPGRPITPRETLTRIQRADLGCAYAAPGVFEIETDARRVYTVVVD